MLKFGGGDLGVKEVGGDQLVENPKRAPHLNASRVSRPAEGTIPSEEWDFQFFGQIENGAVIEFGRLFDLGHELPDPDHFRERQLMHSDQAAADVGERAVVVTDPQPLDDEGTRVDFEFKLKKKGRRDLPFPGR